MSVALEQPALGQTAAESVVAKRFGRAALAAAACAFIAVGAPVVWRGAPLADDFHNCLVPRELGLESFLGTSWERLGMMRLARFVEIAVTTGTCETLPFGIAILVPLALTLSVALLLRGLLRDMRTPAPWADLGGALWLLQPLGTEAGLWPASLHVPLGLALVLLALRLYHRGRHTTAALASFGAAVSIEQAVLALPLAVWLVTPPAHRARALKVSAAIAVSAMAAFALWPGSDVRLRVGPVERLAALTSDPVFYIAFPAVGLGAHSIPLAVAWGWPWSAVAVEVGAIAGGVAAKHLPRGDGICRRDAIKWTAAVVALVVIANVPVLLNVPRQGSPRLFTPTWLVLVAAVAVLAPRVRWRWPLLIGAAGGAFAVGAVLSMVLSVSVRLASADFNERSTRLLAARVPDGAAVAVCGVRRTVAVPAPRGAFSIHEFVYDWAAADALVYYTGRRATFHLAGELWEERSCPPAAKVDVIIAFDDLLREARR